MIRKLVGLVVLVLVATALLSFSSCGRDQELVGISIQPGTETFGDTNTPVGADAGLSVQLRALGSYIHPPVTKDITSQVTWVSNDTQMLTVDSSGVLTVTGISCGSSLISATVKTGKSAGGISSSGAIVTGYMTGSVVCPNGNGGGSGNPALTLTFTGTGSGTVSSTPGGLSCNSPNFCATQRFTSGSSITLTAAPNSPSTFGGWSGCDSGITNPCTVTLNGNRNVTVMFN